MLWIFNELHLIKHKMIFLKVYICCLQVGSFCVNLCLFLVLEEQSYSKISLKPTIFFIWDTWFDINLYTYSFFVMCFLTGSRVYSLVLHQVIGLFETRRMVNFKRPIHFRMSTFRYFYFKFIHFFVDKFPGNILCDWYHVWCESFWNWGILKWIQLFFPILCVFY